MSTTTASILLVDDNTNNLGVLYRYLDDEGFEVLVSQDGERAIRLAQDQKPDLILLDIMLPGISGFEVCEALKADEATADIPVIFISALTGVDDKVHGFRAGGVDYITKPFYQEEVLARINAHITINRQREELDRLNATKDRLFSIIGHDLRGPFMGLLGALQLLRDADHELDHETRQELIENLYSSSETTYHLVENLLEWSRSQQQAVHLSPGPIGLHELVADAMQLFRPGAAQKGVMIESSVPDDLTIYADRDTISSALRNVIDNAVKFTPAGGAVSVRACAEGESIVIAITDTGVGMEPEQVESLFDLNRSGSRRGTSGERGTGLGLILARDYVTRNGGKIEVESGAGKGSTFRVAVPAAPVTQEAGR